MSTDGSSGARRLKTKRYGWESVRVILPFLFGRERFAKENGLILSTIRPLVLTDRPLCRRVFGGDLCWLRRIWQAARVAKRDPAAVAAGGCVRPGARGSAGHADTGFRSTAGLLPPASRCCLWILLWGARGSCAAPGREQKTLKGTDELRSGSVLFELLIMSTLVVVSCFKSS